MEKYWFQKQIKLNLEDKDAMMKLFESEKFVILLVLQILMQSNIIGFMKLVKNLSYASVYGLNEELPFSTNHNVDLFTQLVKWTYGSYI